jgi:predicted metal-dependent HD superfamily phosphohydrolase
MPRDLAERWRRLLKSHGASGSAVEDAFAMLIEAYSSPIRKYHGCSHLADVLDQIDRLAAYAHDPGVVRLAAWFHDAVYDSRREDNEERSAELARRTLRGLGLPTDTITSVADLVLCTKTHAAPDDDWNALTLIDADLAILGTASAEYRAYAEGIRAEYAWVPEEEFRRGRAAVLRRFLERPRIYRTEFMFLDREAAARHNLEHELIGLS